MAVSLNLSCILSGSTCLLLMAAMQIFRSYLISSKLAILFAGYLGSMVFVFILTFINNIENSLFGKNFQSKYTETIISLFTSMFVAGFVHRIAVTSCLIFSLLALYFLNRISMRTYQSNITTTTQQTGKNASSKKRK